MDIISNALFALTISCGFLAAQETPFTVQLSSPLSTATSHKGDAVTALVLEPDAFKGDTVQGHVTESKCGGKLHGEAALNFNFDTLQHGGAAVPISSSITSITNSKGQQNVDEEGRVIRKSSNLGKAAAGTGAGALIGGITHGWKGAAIGAGVGAAASLVLIEVAASGPSVQYTDSIGDAQHNQDLSTRRAEAVQSVPVSQFGVDASRLAAKGFGPAKPVAPNDTVDGRAENRRVEFVKQ